MIIHIQITNYNTLFVFYFFVLHFNFVKNFIIFPDKHGNYVYISRCHPIILPKVDNNYTKINFKFVKNIAGKTARNIPASYYLNFAGIPPFQFKKVLQSFAPAWVTELSESLRFNLTYTLTCYVKLLAYLFKCPCTTVLKSKSEF